MTANRFRFVDFCRSPWNTDEGLFVGARRRRCAALVAALGVTVLMLSAVPAVAAPTLESTDITAAPNYTACVYAKDVINGDRDQKFTSVSFDETKYYIAGYYGITIYPDGDDPTTTPG